MGSVPSSPDPVSVQAVTNGPGGFFLRADDVVARTDVRTTVPGAQLPQATGVMLA